MQIQTAHFTSPTPQWGNWTNRTFGFLSIWFEMFPSPPKKTKITSASELCSSLVRSFANVIQLSFLGMFCLPFSIVREVASTLCAVPFVLHHGCSWLTVSASLIAPVCTWMHHSLYPFSFCFQYCTPEIPKSVSFLIFLYCYHNYVVSLRIGCSLSSVPFF